MSQLAASEFILNKDGSIYHLNLHPGQLARTILLVGDPGRVPKVSKYFDRITEKTSKREFVTHTGFLGEKQLSVISTGIGTDNIDIVLNEADALFNMDFDKRTIKDSFTRLQFIRVGTSGALQKETPVDSLVCTRYAAGFDSLLYFYPEKSSSENEDISRAFSRYASELEVLPVRPYFETVDPILYSKLQINMTGGITLTCPGFYAPQGRTMRGGLRTNKMLSIMKGFAYKGVRCENLEMETSGLFGLARILGHQAASCNAILANRSNDKFSSKPHETVDLLIQQVLTNLLEFG